MLNYFINKIIELTSYTLAIFLNEYLRINRSELVWKKLNIPKRLEELVLSGSTIWSDRNIDW